MKKLLSVVTLAILAALMLASCSLFFNEEKCIEKLKAEGLTEGMCYITEEECARATSLTNSQIKFDGGDFTVEIVRQYGLIENSDYSKSCTFITFATEEQAKQFAELQIKYFSEKSDNPNNWKFARSGCTVVITNLEIAKKIIPLKFK